MVRSHILMCAGAGCLSSGGTSLRDALAAELKKCGLEDEIRFVETGCMGPCDLGPILLVHPDGTLYQRVTAADVPRLVEEHFIKGRPYAKLLPRDKASDAVIRTQAEFSFFAKQEKIVLENCGVIDPENIEEYIARDGYAALGKVLTSMKPEEVIAELKASGLRGRGGAGFPTGLKWEIMAKSPVHPKYLICNADEGDPGAFMDRSVLESDPHRVLEGMAIAAYAVGANKGYIYCRAEYPLAVKRLKIAIRQAERMGLLGKNIGESAFGFDVEVRLGAGAFVCGEETALIASVEGKRGVPRPRPPFPAYSGLFGCPTLLNNVETFANIAPILEKGGAWFASIGTEKSKGTKVFALVGDVMNTGLIEVPMGIKLRDLVFKLGGGIPNGHKFKAVQTGGPSGGCIPEQFLDMSVDYESLASVGSIMGSGGMIVMDETACMVDVAKFFMDFTRDESCGKCIPCRVGTTQLHGLLERISDGRGRLEDLDTLERLGAMVKRTALCGLGQTAPNPVSSTVKYFREEYIDHITHKKCAQGKCSCSNPLAARVEK